MQVGSKVEVVWDRQGSLISWKDGVVEDYWGSEDGVSVWWVKVDRGTYSFTKREVRERL